MKLAEHSYCSGCGVCYAVCPKHAITMCPDDEGFLYPVVDKESCVDCGLCEKKCPVLNSGEPREPKAVFAARAKDNKLRRASSSGGMFSLLARQIIAKGGIVYGAAIRDSDLSVYHCSAENEDELSWLRGSKYVQSDASDVYADVKTKLNMGRAVLFSGTPCQIAALKCFLENRINDNLFCVEVICHAAPSPLAWKKYLEKRVTTSIGGHVDVRPEAVIDRKISFRHKKCGWKRFSISLRFANDMEYLSDLRSDSFLRGFLTELYNRPSCHYCSFRELRSGADITLADYWNVHQHFPQMDDDIGTSVVLVNTVKGGELVKKITGLCEMVESDYEDIRRTNPAVYRSSPPNPRRSNFFKLIHKEADFDLTVYKLLKRPLWRRLGSRIKHILVNIFEK